MRINLENNGNLHRDCVMWLNEHIGPTTGGRYKQEIGTGWRVVKTYKQHSWIPVLSYIIDDEEKALLFRLTWT